MLKVLMSLGFVAFDYLAYGRDKAVCVTNILPHFATCIFKSRSFPFHASPLSMPVASPRLA